MVLILTDINNYIRKTLISNDDFDGVSAIAPIMLQFDLNSFKILISLMDNFSLDFRLSEVCKLHGFEKTKVNKTKWGSLTPNITNSVDTIYINCDLIDNSLIAGEFNDVIYAFSTEDLTRAYPFTKEPIRVGYSEINRNIIHSIRIYITDVFGRIINFNEVETSFTLIIKEM